MEKEYHILSLSGGKDSTALAFFMKENMPKIFEKLELVFCDTECDLPETYDYLNKIEVFIGKKITRIKPLYNFEQLFNIYGILPSAMKRWCTVEMKTKTFRQFLQDKIKSGNKIFVYIGIRADESSRVNNSQDNEIIKQKYPFVEYNIIKEDVCTILENYGIGFPEYYKWRSRSGCYFCFFQKKIEWLNLKEYHPNLFKKALEFEEQGNIQRGKLFTWCQDISLKELIEKENYYREKHRIRNTKSKDLKYKKLVEGYTLTLNS